MILQFFLRLGGLHAGGQPQPPRLHGEGILDEVLTKKIVLDKVLIVEDVIEVVMVDKKALVEEDTKQSNIIVNGYRFRH